MFPQGTGFQLNFVRLIFQRVWLIPFSSYMPRDDPIPYSQCVYTYMPLQILFFIYGCEKKFKVFSFCVKQAAIISLMCVRELCTYIYMYVDTRGAHMHGLLVCSCIQLSLIKFS